MPWFTESLDADPIGSVFISGLIEDLACLTSELEIATWYCLVVSNGLKKKPLSIRPARAQP